MMPLGFYALPFLFSIVLPTAAAPVPEREADPINAAADDPNLDYGHQEWKCNDPPAQPSPELDYDQCKETIASFTARYPPTSRADRYTLLHLAPPGPPPPNPFFCPKLWNEDERPYSCDFIFDYVVYPDDEPVIDNLDGVKEQGESFIRKCEREGKYFGGLMKVHFGYYSWILRLETKVAIA